MIEIIKAIGIWTGVLIGTLKIIDFLLTEYQKTILKMKTENLWIWLASRSFKKYSSFLMNRKFHFLSLVIAYLLYVIPFIVAPMIDNEIEILEGVSGSSLANMTEGISSSGLLFFKIFDVIVLILSAVLIYKYVLNNIFSWLIKNLSYQKYYFRLLMLNFVGFTVIPLIGAMGMLFSINFLLESEFSKGLYFFVMVVYSIIIIPSGIFLNVSSILFLLSFIWLLIIIPLLMGIFKVLQFIVFRVAESKSGVVMGLSGLLIGIGMILNTVLKSIQ